MKSSFVLLVSLLLSAPVFSYALTAEASKYRCECFPNSPFEGFIIYVVETHQGTQSWLTLEASPTNYDTAETCQAAIKANLTCDELSRLKN